MAITEKRPMIKETVGAFYYAFFDAETDLYDDTVKSPVIKTIGKTEEAETVTVRASGIDYDTISQLAGVDLAVEVVAFHPDDLAKARGEVIDATGLKFTGGGTKRPFVALGFPVFKKGGGIKYEWYPKCKLVENTDDIATSEDTFSEQNDTLTFKAYAFNDDRNVSVVVDMEATLAPEGLTEAKFFEAPILTPADLTAAIGAE